MAIYTTEVRKICESLYVKPVGEEVATVDKVITQTAPKVFDFDFPIFDENYRLVFEKKILRHFYTREIGLETVGLWKLKLEDKLNEIMPYLNKFYAMYVKEVNPEYNYDLTRHHNGSSDRTEKLRSDNYNHATSESDGTSNAQQLYSDTPQNRLDDVQNGKYLTNATFDNSSNHAEGKSFGDGWVTGDNSIKDIDDYYETVQGRSGVLLGEVWKKFKEGFFNVDKMLFDELEVLFMQLW